MASWTPARFLVVLVFGAGVGACFNAPSAAVMFACDPAGEAACPAGYSCAEDACCHRDGTEVTPDNFGSCQIGGGQAPTSGGTTTATTTTGATSEGSSGEATTGVASTTSSDTTGTSADGTTAGETGTGETGATSGTGTSGTDTSTGEMTTGGTTAGETTG